MIPEIILRKHQTAKRITRLGNGSFLKKLFCGLSARLSGIELFLAYKSGLVRRPDKLTGSGGMVVSMTSFPKRIGSLWMVVDCLMRQTLPPAEIVLTLFEGDFPDHFLPESLQPYIDRGLTVLWADDDLKPHLKYRHAFLREAVIAADGGYPRCVVTVDDDLFYAPDALERLYGLHLKYPDAVCANIARRVNDFGYNAWEAVNVSAGPSSDMVALGFGGVLYPPSFFIGRSELYDTDTIRKVCLRQDDLWLKHIEDSFGVMVATGEFFAVPPEIPSSQTVSLRADNVGACRNDSVWNTLKDC